MKKHLVWLLSVSFLSGYAMASPIENPSTSQRMAVISAIYPVMQGETVGVTLFGNARWTAETMDFDVNAVALSAIKEALNRDVKLVNGNEVGLVQKIEKFSLSAGTATNELKQKLIALGLELQVDLIALVQTTRAHDWIGRTNQYVEGFGHYSRHRNAAYGVFLLRIFDCKAGKFTRDATVTQAQMLPGVEWHNNWKDYTPEEQRVILRGLGSMVQEGMPALLSQAGLSDTKVAPRSLSSSLLSFGRSEPHSYVPQGNQIDIPAGVSLKVARLAVLAGFKERDWTVITDTDEQVIGRYRKGKKEAGCSVTFQERRIILVPEGCEIQADGKRVPTEYRRWQNNLKESIVEELLKSPADGEP